MSRRLITFVLAMALVAAFVGGPGALAGSGDPRVEGSSIPVDADVYYKQFTGATAKAKIDRDTKEAAATLAQDVRESGGRAAGVGEVHSLYADGWRDFTLRAVDGNAEIWVANDLSYPEGDPRPTPVVTDEQVAYLLNEYNTRIYPGATNYYGFTKDRDGSNGVFAERGYDWYKTDNPQRMMILVYNILDEAYEDPEFPFYTAGFFWADMTETYADRNIIHIDSHDWENRIGPDAARPYLYEQVFTHEFEHAIHYDHDPGEPSWVDEGLADLAPYLVGYGHSTGHIAEYLVLHRLPLTVWGGGLEDYGKSYLFQLYLLENFGGPAFVKGLVNDPAKGIAGIENQISAQGYDAEFDEIFRDWALALYLDDTSLTGVSGGKLGFDSLQIPSEDTEGYSIQWSIKNYYGGDHHGNLPLPRYYGGSKSGTVEYPIGTLMPYTPMYQTFAGFSPQLINDFRGDAKAGLMPFEGDYQLWGNRGDLITTTATMANPIVLGANATLSFQANWQIEELWDFAFAQISTDGGATWTSLANGDTVAEADPSAITGVVENLPGFTGTSDGWREEAFDLAAYEGQSVLFRFLYITDWASNEPGIYVDNVAVADDSGELFSDGLEASGDNWVYDGWMRTTGLADNDWQLTFLNPITKLGKFQGYEITDAFPVLNGIGTLQLDGTVLNTQFLGNRAVTVVTVNHLPEATSFAAGYRLTISKGTAKK